MTDFTQLQQSIGSANARQGWHDRFHTLEDPEAINDHLVAKVMLANTELAEAVEELRSGRDFGEMYLSAGDKPEGFAVEVADAVIRLLDLMEMLDIDLEHVIEWKLRYNETRNKMHGRKF